MTKRDSLDERPGHVPEIRTDGDSLTYLLDMLRIRGCPRLVIRCDVAGNVWSSIEY